MALDQVLVALAFLLFGAVLGAAVAWRRPRRREAPPAANAAADLPAAAEAIARETQLAPDVVFEALVLALQRSGLPAREQHAPGAPAVDPELRAVFEQEAGELLHGLQIQLRRWLRASGDAAPRAAMLRALNLLKGSARVAGAPSLGDAAQRMEQQLRALAPGEAKPNAQHALLAQAGAVQDVFDRLRSGARPAAATAARAARAPTTAAPRSVPAPPSDSRVVPMPPRRAPPEAPSPGPRATPAAPVVAAPPATLPDAGAGAPLVLVVDDSVTVRRVAQRHLQRAGFRVALAEDGVEAMALLRQERPCAVLSDVEMPRMDGFELARTIRADGLLSRLPIIMISSRVADATRAQARQVGVNHYLGKPYAEDELIQLVRRYAGAQVAQPA